MTYDKNSIFEYWGENISLCSLVHINNRQRSRHSTRMGLLTGNKGQDYEHRD